MLPATATAAIRPSTIKSKSPVNELAAEYKRLGDRLRQLDKQLKKIEQEAIVKMPAPDQRATEGPEREKVLKEKLKNFLSAEESSR